MLLRSWLKCSVVAAVVSASLATVAAPAAAASGTITGTTQWPFSGGRGDEVILALTASATATSWATSGSESAVVSVSVDGIFKTDVVLYRGDITFTYNVLLGQLATAGPHTVSVAYNEAKSTVGATGATVTGLVPQAVTAADPRYTVLAHAPILYGRSIVYPYENNHTDTPEIMYHTVTQDGSGTIIEYTYVFSNEDGGSGANANIGPLMARWGRATDIEWAYRVKIDSRGRVKSKQYQGDGHAVVNFTGLKEANHPLLYVMNSYNTFGQVTNAAGGYRFSLDPLDTIDSGRAREQAMDKHPESYWVMAMEAIREGAIKDPVGSPATADVSDLRNYLYLEINKTTTYSSPPDPGSWVGVAVAVQLKNDPNWYTSHHSDGGWSIQRDGPASTTVELPGRASNGILDFTMVQAIKVIAVRNGTPPSYSITIAGVNKGFFLDAGYHPQASFVSGGSGITLTDANGADGVVVWRAG